MDDFKHGTSSGYSYRKCRCEECVAYHKAENRKYYERHREEVKARNAAYAKANKDKLYAADRARRQRNLEEVRAKDRARYAADPEAQYKRQRRYEERYPWRTWYRGWYRRAQERGEIYAPEVLEWIKNLETPKCSYCGGRAETIDHILARSKGGNNDRANLTPSCHRCNKRKGSMSAEAFFERMRGN